MNPKQKKTLIVLLAVAFVGLAVFVGWYKTSLPRRFTEVAPGVLYRSGQGKANQIQNAVKQYNINTILCLREVEDEKDSSWFEMEKALAEKLHVKFIHWPMDSHDPLPKQYWIDFMKMTKDLARTPILVHCAQGKHRTGFFVALYRMGIDGWSFDQACAEMQSFEFGNDHPEIVDTLKKIDPEELRKKIKE